MQLLIATGNMGKLRQFRQMLQVLPCAVVAPADVGLAGLEVVEDGQTFEDNARLKALAYAQASGLPALADDSGLLVDALAGAPGVYSARYAGLTASDADNNAKLLKALADVPEAERTARYRAVLVFHDPRGVLPELVAEGTCEGRIGVAPKGDGGFGYDPLFFAAGQSATMGELPEPAKLAISHRGRATQRLVALLHAAMGDVGML